MSLFERITIKLNEAKVTGDTTPESTPESESQAEKLKKQRDALAKKKGYVLNSTEKKKGMRLGDKLEKDIDKGLKLQDKTIGKRTPRQGYDVGMPFQADDNKATKSGRYKTSGKKILDNRIKYELDTKGITKDNTKARLQQRIRNIKDPSLQGKEIKTFVDKVTDKQKLSNRKGKNSTLFKTLKKYTDATEPTQQGKYGKPKRMVKGKDGVIRQYGGGQVPIKDAKRKAAAVKKGVDKFNRNIVKAAKLPKDTYIPKTASGSAPFDPKELNLQFKADKLKLDYGGRIANRDPKISGMTAAEKKRNYEKIKAAIDKKNPTFKSPFTDKNLPVTPENMKKYKIDATGATTSKRKRFMNFAKNVGGKSKNFAKKGAAGFGKLPLKGKAAVIAGAGLAAYGLYDVVRKKLRGPVLGKDDFTKTAPIKYGSGSKESDRPKGKKIGDIVRFQYASKDDPNVKDKAGSSLTPDALNKFKTKKYSVKTKSGADYDLVSRMKNSAFAQQVKQAQKRQNKKDQAFLKRVKNSPEVKGY